MSDELLRQRIVVVRGALDDALATATIAKLLFLEHEDASAPVQLHLDSAGGEVLAGLAIRDTIDHITPAVSTHCLGSAHGIAGVVLAHGRRGQRTASAQARITLTPLAARRPVDVDHIARLTAVVVDMLAGDTGQPRAQVEADLAAGRRFDAEQARAYGLIDRVV